MTKRERMLAAVVVATGCINLGRPTGTPRDATTPAMCPPDGGVTSAQDPPGDGIDQNCDGVDGVATDTVFVSESGTDSASAGATPSEAVRSLPFALRRARELGRSVILMQTGSYDSLHGPTGPMIVMVDRPMTIVGRYLARQWIARDLSSVPKNDTTVSGPNVGVAIRASNVTLRGLTIEGRLLLAADGASVYGVFADEAVNLTLQDLVISAGDAAPGIDGRAGVVGADGRRGEDALSNGTGGRGGTSCNGTNAGGEGGDAVGGFDPDQGRPGEASLGRTPAAGGPAGDSFDTRGRDGTAGVDGAPGRTGRNGLLGFYTSDGFTSDWGLPGSSGDPGTGGGGGGGAYSTMLVVGGGGGGGGGGGCGGSPGSGGEGGGGSFGVFLYGGVTTARLMTCAITTGRGGGSGAGGVSGGVPGDGGVPEASRGGLGGAGAFGRSTTSDAGVTENRGGSGGAGGRGGIGGGGGPGLGGPSIGVVQVAGATASIDATTRSRIVIGAVGANGAGLIEMPLAQYHDLVVSLRESAPDAGVSADAATRDATSD